MKRCRHLIALLLPTILAGCSSNDGPDEKAIMLSDIVTVVSSTDADGTTFTFQRYDDQPLITLTAPDYSTDRIEAGQRALLYYYPTSGKAYTSGEVSVRALQAINNGATQVTALDTYDWDATPVWLTSVWRSGLYLNLRLRLSYSPAAREFRLIADETTVDNSMPDLYLVHDLNGESESYLRDVIASFDISSVWSRTTCRGVTLHVNDTNLNQSTYTFTKSE